MSRCRATPTGLSLVFNHQPGDGNGWGIVQISRVAYCAVESLNLSSKWWDVFHAARIATTIAALKLKPVRMLLRSPVARSVYVDGPAAAHVVQVLGHKVQNVGIHGMEPVLINQCFPNIVNRD